MFVCINNLPVAILVLALDVTLINGQGVFREQMKRE